MDVPVREFYKEVMGKTVATTHSALSALDRWHVPYFSNTAKGSEKMYWRVDIKYVDHAKNAQVKLMEAKAAKKAKKTKKPNVQEVDGFTIVQRMANVEQELRTLNTTLQEFMKKYA